MNRAPPRTLALLLVSVLALSAVAPATAGLAADAASAGDASVGDASTSDASAGAADLTYVESDITEDTTWNAADGPYRIAADVTVEAGATLTVEPGTTVQPAAGIRITVEGNLTAEGTESDPITVATAPQAPDAVRWASIRYEGGPRSHLSLAHATLENATNALTVGSSAGRIDVTGVTVRNASRDGIRVVNGTGTPKLTVEDSTFTDIGERGIAVTPGVGAVGESRVTSNSSSPGNRTEHQLALALGADTTMDAFRVAYRGHGGVGEVDRSSIRKFGLDLDGNGSVDWNLLPLVKTVVDRSNSYEIRLRRTVTVPADATVRVAYEGVENPRTYGTYPVEVDLRTNGVAQTATTVLSFDLRSSGEQSALDSPPSRASDFSVTGSTFDSTGEQGVFVAADVAREFRITGNSFSDTRGSGIALRGRRVDSVTVRGNRLAEIGREADGVRIAGRRLSDLTVRRNRIAGADAGVGLYARNENADRIRVVSNVVTDSTTGVRVRHRAEHYSQHLSMTLADNELADNAGRGLSVVAPSTRLEGVTVRGNEISGNGNAGLSVEANVLTGTAVRDNVIEDNDAAGARLLAGRFVRSAVRNNTVARNRGDGLSVRTELVVHDVSVTDNRVLDNAGVGLNVNNSLTHAGAVELSRNLVAANAYGIRVAGAFGARILNNTVVYNTYGLGAPVRTDGYRPGTGIVVEEGEAGAIFRTGEVTEPLRELVDDRQVGRMLDRRSPDTYTVVLRPNEAAHVWEGGDAALTVRALSADIPTGVVLRKSDESRQRVVVRGNDVYGHDRGMTVNVSTLVDANTTARLFVNATRTVVAERNYWGAESGPTHASIHPEGTGDRVVTRRGWVDFVPSAASPHGPRYHRPVANVTASPNPAAVGERVVLSGRESSDGDGRVETYRFAVAPRQNVTGPTAETPSSPTATASFGETGNYTVSLVVANELGVESADPATATVAVRNRSATPTTAEAAMTDPAATTAAERSANPTTTLSANGEGGLVSQLSVLATLGGLLGLVLYGGALALGAVGAVQTVRRAGVPVGGKTINGLAVAGMAVWVAAGLLGTDGLLAVGVGSGVLWVALVVLLWALTRFIYD
ncbi:right-handed parallel beta-helix repeat-containing protein [Halorussus limi]|uniref:Right-handed parallel beta-helix repeat-containing protein n=1 Tax=Halorussus limi TaxID=2938695 RepID=A0A8U0HXT0_9EURY|nr:right-handed parallel beta-helix repeat-containing protein [Halorussus limi]UPV75965.1 right-handed parallel beta-helix repeat-containing protein [Halorussus limi]